jgi:hypothetical protein
VVSFGSTRRKERLFGTVTPVAIPVVALVSFGVLC